MGRRDAEHLSTHGRYGLSFGFCVTHQKLIYTSRKVARRAANRLPVARNAYRCDVHQDMWHIGRLPEEIRHGHVDKATFYGGLSA